jgi:SET domain-containing protein
MLVIATYLAQSGIHGLGVFAGRGVRKGEVVSRFMPPFDVHYPAELLAALTPAEQNYLRNYSYFSRFSQLWILPGDHDRYMNHSEEPNVGMHPSGSTENVALRDIAAGEELTCDYRSFDLEWAAKLGQPER